MGHGARVRIDTYVEAEKIASYHDVRYGMTTTIRNEPA